MQQHSTTPTNPTTNSVLQLKPEYSLRVTKQQSGGYKWKLSAGVKDRVYAGWASDRPSSIWDAANYAHRHDLNLPQSEITAAVTAELDEVA